MLPPHLGALVFITGCCVPKAFPWGFLALSLCPHLEGPVMEELLLRLAHHLTDLCSLFRAACGFFFIRNKVLLCSPG